MKVVLTGASGLLGRALDSSWSAEGHDVVRLVRRTPSSPDEARWDPEAGTVDRGAVRGAQVVVHLAGAGIGDRPWTPGQKRVVMDSRVQGTTTIAKAVADAGVPTLLSMSGIGIYGNPGDRVCDESSPIGSTYVAEVARRWEASTGPAEDSARVAHLRTSPVVAGKDGIFGSRLLPIFRLGLGGRVGSGRQWWSWIALEDYVRAVRLVADREDIEGPVNVTAPEPLTNGDMTKAIGRVLHRPTIAVAPGFALKAVFRDFGEDLLGGQRVVPRRLLDAGFTFAHPTFEPALRESLAVAHPRVSS